MSWWNNLAQIFTNSQEEQTQMLNEAPANKVSLEEMTKEELDNLGAHHGIKLDRRKKKATMIQELKDNNILHG